jgi:hypothetical protein
MRLLLFTACAFLLLALSAHAQKDSGLLGSLKSFFRPRRQPQQGGFNQPQQSGFNQPQQFNQQQHQRPQSGGFQGQQQFRQQQQPRHQGQQQQTNFATHPAQTSNPSFRVVNNEHSNSNSHSSDRECKALPYEDPNDREFPRCPNSKANHREKGIEYILTFDLNNDDCTKFTGYQADNYCKAQGGRAVSLDSNEKSQHFIDISARFAQRYYWTGGRMNHPCKTLYWPSGKSEGYEAGKRYWSKTGGSIKKSPQPDNRNYDQDGLEDEICLAVLNNFYSDNITWHDVACHHKKPTICELGNF